MCFRRAERLQKRMFEAQAYAVRALALHLTLHQMSAQYLKLACWAGPMQARRILLEQQKAEKL